MGGIYDLCLEFFLYFHLNILHFLIKSFYRESDITKERINKILEAGVNVVLTTGGIDDLCLKYFVEAGAMAVRRCKKQDLKRIAKATGGRCLFVYCVSSAQDLHLVKKKAPRVLVSCFHLTS